MALADNLVAYWPLDEASGTAIDAHGNNDLTDLNTVGSAAGKVGNARDFEAGNAEALNIADNTDLSTGDVNFAIQAWVQLESKGADRIIVAKLNAGATQNEFHLRYQSSSDRFQFRIYSSGGGTMDVNADALGSPSTGVWYHIICWHDADTNEIGIVVNAGTANITTGVTAPADGNGGFSIGKEGDREADYWDGLIDEVGFWKGRILTSDERTELFNAGDGRDYDYITGGGGTDYTLTAESGTFALTGTAASLKCGRALAAASGTFALTGIAATLKCGRVLVGGGGAFALTGQSAGLLAGRILVGASGSFALTGQAASLTAGRRLSAEPAVYVLTGQPATLVYSGEVVPSPKYGGACQFDTANATSLFESLALSSTFDRRAT